MAIPEKPLSRLEQYLDAIATNTGGGGGGSGGGVLVVNWNTATGALDKTWQEIYDADFAVIHNADELDRVYAFVQEVMYDDPDYVVMCFATGGGTVNNFDFIAESADGYPAMQGGGG